MPFTDTSLADTNCDSRNAYTNHNTNTFGYGYGPTESYTDSDPNSDSKSVVQSDAYPNGDCVANHSTLHSHASWGRS